MAAGSTCIQQMQKALTQMNVQFQHVISDITGLTGLAILDAIVEGERDPAVLARLRLPGILTGLSLPAVTVRSWAPAGRHVPGCLRISGRDGLSRAAAEAGHAVAPCVASEPVPARANGTGREAGRRSRPWTTCLPGEPAGIGKGTWAGRPSRAGESSGGGETAGSRERPRARETAIGRDEPRTSERLLPLIRVLRLIRVLGRA